MREIPADRNARASSTPHHVGQVTKAQLTLAEPLERWGLTEPGDRARYLVEQLQELGWIPPRDPNADTPPRRPAHVADDDSPGRREFREGLCLRYGHPATSGATCDRCGEQLPNRPKS